MTVAAITSEDAISCSHTSRTLAGKVSLVLMLILFVSTSPSCVSGLLTIALIGGGSDMVSGRRDNIVLGRIVYIVHLH